MVGSKKDIFFYYNNRKEKRYKEQEIHFFPFSKTKKRGRGGILEIFLKNIFILNKKLIIY
jgi:hypothetical protein